MAELSRYDEDRVAEVVLALMDLNQWEDGWFGLSEA